MIFGVVQTFVAQPYQVQQQSMETTLLPDQYVLVDKLTPRFDDYSRGDIVVFNPVIRQGDCSSPVTSGGGPEAVPYIKRVIGEPGDVVQIGNGVVVNGVTIDEPYVHGAGTEPISGETTWTVQPGRLFVMGDNRPHSVDSRSESVGEICLGDVVGRAVLRYWPLSALGVLQTPTYGDIPN